MQSGPMLPAWYDYLRRIPAASNLRAYIAAEFARERMARGRAAVWRLNFIRDVLDNAPLGFKQLRGSSYKEVHEEPKTTRIILDGVRRNLPFFSGASIAARCATGHRLLIDVTDVICRRFTTGIQRVVRQLVREADTDSSVVPVLVMNGRLFSCFPSQLVPQELEISERDKFIMADVTWNDIPGYQAAMQHVAYSGGSNVLILHDIIPLVHPELFPKDFYPDTVANHAKWFNAIVTRSDAVVTVSRTVADDFFSYIACNRTPINPHLRLGWFHLGGDLKAYGEQTRSTQTASFCNHSTPFVLSVGSLEPRKGIGIALDAMEQLWRQGSDVRYVIVGSYRYAARALANRIIAHPENGRRLFWRDRTSDGDLYHLYKNARALVFPSIAEGFGLPLVEAAALGLPAIASDIPVFREIGGDAIAYFEAGDPTSLAAKLGSVLARPKTANTMPFLTWRESTRNLLRMISEDAYQFGTVWHAPTKAGMRA